MNSDGTSEVFAMLAEWLDRSRRALTELRTRRETLDKAISDTEESLREIEAVYLLAQTAKPLQLRGLERCLSWNPFCKGKDNEQS